MDFKRMMIVMSLSMLILIGWEAMFPTPKPQQQAAPAAQQVQAKAAEQQALTTTSPITVKTDTVEAVIDEKSGDLHRLTLLKYNAATDESKPFVLLDSVKDNTYVAQSELLDANGNNVLKDVSFRAAQKQYTLNGETLEVRLTAPETKGLSINKVYTFHKNSYLVDVRFDVRNGSGEAVKLTPSYRMVRDNRPPEGQGWFMHSYTGPALYTPEGEFQKVAFDDLDDDFQTGKDTAEYQRKTNGGYIGMIQHYFVSAWLMQPNNGENLCAAGCQMDVKRRADNLYSAGVNVAAADVGAGASKSFVARLYAGPQVTSLLEQAAEHLVLAKDYGRVYIFASPLFAILKFFYGLVGNWGWAIVLLTILVKIVLFPLNDKAYKSMAKMRTVAPKMEALRKKYPNPEDRMAMQQAMMQLYRDEKINPLGGCLPMLLQMPIFIGLYWMIFLSVELRQAPWMLWVHDLSRPDSWYILPALMMATMWFQTTLNPPPSDPMQAQMMKIMPLIFGVMFFFFPSGLVLYYVVNNLLTIAQQWYINRKFELETANGVVLDKEPAKNTQSKKK
ncbi:membrane protein insertase YidC [Conchiformibius steedae DSM 2580]|uniref:Membrane protein insertase YidC n=1 Tax=Conchiformibius steedae DSM 2580 TaxID=1121352 RepID=A0AAE9HX00_9NEIS|nr:membrane protein insertase YidC [Conchiformibius steedae]QMT33534.1 membrane protein insertase YidC [Conchiformibius steedae]URD68193.1 membrane protein insertase YidC [Conchiformibius steedae DSM 2580]